MTAPSKTLVKDMLDGALGSVAMQRISIERTTIVIHTSLHDAALSALQAWGYTIASVTPCMIGGLETVVAETKSMDAVPRTANELRDTLAAQLRPAWDAVKTANPQGAR